jgi:N-acetyl-D-muramate 6-phosphate phosphatase
MISAVVFDVGETLLDDTAEYGRWADWIGAPRHTFSALLGAVTALGRSNIEAFRLLRPGFDFAAELARREAAGAGEQITDGDLYPDVRPALSALRADGIWVGIAGNQTARAAELLRGLELPADQIATSGEWHAGKPESAFFDRVAGLAPVPREQILYVGDQRDIDILPARRAGLRAALIRRGPLGYLWADDPVVRDNADWVLGSLAELPGLIRAASGGRDRQG